MSKTFFIIFLFLFCISCGKSHGGSGNEGFIELNQNDLTAEVAPIQAQTFEINAKLSGFEREQEDKILRAFELIKRVISTNEFKRQILGKSYQGKKQFVDNDGLTNAQIYTKLIEGAETLNPVRNITMDLMLEAYRESANVIGYTKPNTKVVYVNTRYLDMRTFTENEVAMNIIHEWLHKIGFNHSAKMNPARPHSVPYAIGYIMGRLAGEIDKLNLK